MITDIAKELGGEGKRSEVSRAFQILVRKGLILILSINGNKKLCLINPEAVYKGKPRDHKNLLLKIVKGDCKEVFFNCDFIQKKIQYLECECLSNEKLKEDDIFLLKRYAEYEQSKTIDYHN